VKLRLAEMMAERDPARTIRLLHDLQAEVGGAVEDLRELARGIYPPVLADRGLPDALAAQTRRSTVPVDIDADGIGRYQQETEAAVYFCCLEALQNVAKYAGPSRVQIRLSETLDQLTFQVVDDGVGFDAASTSYGSGLRNMADRVAALGGTVDVESHPGRGTTVTGRIPAGGRTPGATSTP
jgi:signal transduction histidine kinase